MNTRLLFLLILPLALSSCVSQQKYNRAVDSQARMNLLRQQYLAENERLAFQLDSLQNDTILIAEAFSEQEKLDSVETGDMDDMVSKNVEMGQTRGAELNTTARLQSSTPIISSQMREIQQREKAINKLIVDLEDVLNEFQTEELNMRAETDGVYITLHEKLLFQNNDLTIISRGQQALEALARVLKDNPNTNLRIEGHIDTPSVQENSDKDSWEMSLDRAKAVGKALHQSYGITGDKIIVSGRGDFLPLAQNQYPMARVLNRRVEVVFLPEISGTDSVDSLIKK